MSPSPADLNPSRKRPRRRPPRILRDIVVAGVLIFIGIQLFRSADASTPADPLYPIDKEIEQVRRTFTTDPVSQANLEIEILEERYGELENIEGRMTDADEQAAAEDPQPSHFISHSR